MNGNRSVASRPKTGQRQTWSYETGIYTRCVFCLSKSKLTTQIAAQRNHRCGSLLLFCAALQQHPRLLRLQILISESRNGQHMFHTVTEFRILHGLNVLLALAIDQRQQHIVRLVEAHFGHVAAEVLFAKHQRTIDEIAEIVQQFRIVARHQIAPAEVRVLTLGPSRRQIESPHIRSDARRLSIIAEHPDATTLAELAVLVVQVFGGHQMGDDRVALVQAEQRRREHDRVEGHIVLGHELVQIDFNVVRFRHPPLLPFAGVSRGYRQIPNGGVKPHVEHLRFETLHRHRDAPFQIARNASWPQTLLQPRLGNHARIVRPAVLDGGKPFAQFRLDFRQIEEELLRLANFGRCAANAAPGLQQLVGVHQFAAVVALITARIIVAARLMRACSLHETIGQETIAFRAQQLIHRLRVHEATLAQIQEHFLRDSEGDFSYVSIKYFLI